VGKKKGKEKDDKDSIIEGNEGDYRIVKRIDAKLSEIGMTRPELTEKVKGIKGTFANNTLSNWAARKTIPSADIAVVIADALLCSVRWLVTGEDDKEEEYSVEEKNLIKKYRRLDGQGQYEVKALLDAKLQPVGKETVPEIRTLKEKTEKQATKRGA